MLFRITEGGSGGGDYECRPLNHFLVQISAPLHFSGRTCHLCSLTCRKAVIMEPTSLKLLWGLNVTKYAMDLACCWAPSLGCRESRQRANGIKDEQVHTGGAWWLLANWHHMKQTSAHKHLLCALCGHFFVPPLLSLSVTANSAQLFLLGGPRRWRCGFFKIYFYICFMEV